MRLIELQLSDKLYDRASKRAASAGFANIDEFIVEMVEDELSSSSVDFDDRFTSKVVSDLDTVSKKAKSGAKTYIQAELDKRYQDKSRAWRKTSQS